VSAGARVGYCEEERGILMDPAGIVVVLAGRVLRAMRGVGAGRVILRGVRMMVW
jgi:hypothetical protein